MTHLSPNDVVIDFDKSSLVMRSLSVDDQQRQLAESNNATIVYFVSFIDQYIKAVSGESALVQLLNATSGGSSSKFTKVLTKLADQTDVTDLQQVTAAALTLDKIVTISSLRYTVKTTYPTSVPSKKPVVQPVVTSALSGSALIGFAVGLTLAGIGLIAGCYFFTHTDTFHLIRGSALKTYKSFKPKPPIKTEKDLEEESKYEHAELHRFDLEMAEIYRKQSPPDKLTVNPSRRPPSRVTSLDESVVKSRLDVSKTTDNPWEKRFSDHHKQHYWRNRLTGKVSWTNPVQSNPSPEKATTSLDHISVTITSPSSPYTPGRNKFDDKLAAITSPEIEVPSLSPSVWEEKFSQKYQLPYWRHKSSGAISWERPAEMDAGIATKKAIRANLTGVLSKDALRLHEARSSGLNRPGVRSSDTRSASSAISAGSNKSNHRRKSDISKVESTHSRASINSVKSTSTQSMFEHPDFEKKFSKKYGLPYWRHRFEGTVHWEPPPLDRPAVALDNGTMSNEKSQGERRTPSRSQSAKRY